MVWTILATNAALLVVCFVALWLLCLKLGDVTPVDSFWAWGMLVMALATFVQADSGQPQRNCCWLRWLRCGRRGWAAT